MGIKRIVDTSFWTDNKIVDYFSSEDKYFMLYLLTNPHTRQLGIYKLNKKQAAFELGYSIDDVSTLLERFENSYDLIKYNDITQELAIKNYLKHSIIRGGKPVEDCIKKDAVGIKDISLFKYILSGIISHDPSDKSNIYSFLKIFLSEKCLVLNENENENDIDNDNDNDNDRYVPPIVPRYVDVSSKSSNTNKKINVDDTLDDTLDDTYHDTYHDTSTTRKINLFKKIIKTYSDNIGMITAIINEDLQHWINDGVEEELIIQYIVYAVEHGGKSYSYIKKMISTNFDKNIKTLEQFKAHEIEFNKKKQPKGKEKNDINDFLKNKLNQEEQKWIA